MKLQDYAQNKPVLETEQLILRPLRKEDVSDLKEWLGDSSIYQYWGKRPGKSVLSPISRNNTAFWRAAARQEIYMEFLKNPPEQGSGQPVTCSTSGMGLRLK